ncbi:hypothetical protein [Sphingomonas oligophenolica]|nr:hypothetical protein [Sphingomonas oligophenolica]
MDDFTRLAIAGGIVALVLIIAVPWAIIRLRKRRREKLRRRGIKKYGH